MGNMREFWVQLIAHLQKVDVMLLQYLKFEMSRNHTIRARSINDLRRENTTMIKMLGGDEDE